MEPITILNAAGVLTDPATAPHHLAKRVQSLTPQDLRDMYTDMTVVRAFDTQATALQRQGELGLWCSGLGQEAAQVASARALARADMAFPSYRDHGVIHARGIDLTEILPMFRGVDHGGWDTAAHGCHLYTLVVGAQVLPAVGYALGLKLEEANAAVMVYLGDGAMSEGEVSEAMVWAASADLPVVFLCQNNGWAISTPTQAVARTDFARRSEGFGIPGVRVDGNDVVACYAAAAGALERARAGGGPTFIEAVTYRMGAHTTSDDPGRYRDSAECDRWAQADPLRRLRTYLEGAGLAGPDFFQAADDAATAIAERTREACRGLAAPRLRDFFELTYAAPHALVAEESAAFDQVSTLRAGAHGGQGESAVVEHVATVSPLIARKPPVRWERAEQDEHAGQVGKGRQLEYAGRAVQRVGGWV
jgi:pyruvate dehydrogenase E1 component alpha subunit